MLRRECTSVNERCWQLYTVCVLYLRGKIVYPLFPGDDVTTATWLASAANNDARRWVAGHAQMQWIEDLMVFYHLSNGEFTRAILLLIHLPPPSPTASNRSAYRRVNTQAHTQPPPSPLPYCPAQPKRRVALHAPNVIDVAAKTRVSAHTVLHYTHEVGAAECDNMQLKLWLLSVTICSLSWGC